MLLKYKDYSLYFTGSKISEKNAKVGTMFLVNAKKAIVFAIKKFRVKPDSSPTRFIIKLWM